MTAIQVPVDLAFTIPTATPTSDGLLSSADKVRLDGLTASKIASTPAGNLSATNVQAALNELAVEKAQIGHVHSAATTSTNGFMTSADKNKLNNIDTNATVGMATVPTASITFNGIMTTEWAGITGPNVTQVTLPPTPFNYASLTNFTATPVNIVGGSRTCFGGSVIIPPCGEDGVPSTLVFRLLEGVWYKL